MVQTSKTGSVRKRGAKAIQTRDYWVSSLVKDSRKQSNKEKPAGLFARLSPESKKYITKLSTRMGYSISYTMDTLLTKIRKESEIDGKIQCAPWLLEALDNFSEENYGTPIAFYTRVTTENKKYVERLAAKAKVSISLLLEVLIWEIEKHDYSAN